MKVFNNNEFVEKCKWLVNDVPNYYWSENGTWCNYNWDNQKFMMDCVVSIKGLLWGFYADKNLAHGGAIYLSNGVADFGANQGIDFCTDVNNNFTNLIAGEYLCMAGTPYDHAGIYLGNGKVFECTCGWGVNKCVISDIDQFGNRFLNGVQCLNWTYHGKLNYIDYLNEPEPQPIPPTPQPETFNIGDYVVPTVLIDYQGTPLVQYDDVYQILEKDERGNVLGAVRGNERPIWAVLPDSNIKHIE